MGNHINKDGQFQSDKHPDLPPDKIILSFKDPVARVALGIYALALKTDIDLKNDILWRIDNWKD